VQESVSRKRAVQALAGQRRFWTVYCPGRPQICGTGNPAALIHDRIPLSFAQQRLWFLHRVDPGAPVTISPWHSGLSAGWMSPLEHSFNRNPSAP